MEPRIAWKGHPRSETGYVGKRCASGSRKGRKAGESDREAEANQLEQRLLTCSYMRGGKSMLWTLFVILFIMWLLGMVTSYTLGGFIHILLVLALVAVVIQLITGRQPL